MTDTSFLPTLSQSDIDQASHLIQQAYVPPTQTTSPDQLRRLQQELFEIQKRPEAWGLVIPLLNHQDQNVQFFGAHTAQVKIARDWDSFPTEHAEHLRDLIIQLTAHSIAVNKGKFILRKLFVALTSLALKLASTHPNRWENWILSCTTAFAGSGGTEPIHDFLSIVAEEVGNADLLGPSKMRMNQSLNDATLTVVESITTCLVNKPSLNQVQAALRCLQAWIAILPSSQLTPLIPLLISLLDPGFDDVETAFVAASDTIQEIMAKSALSDGSGSRTLTEPLLLWLDSTGGRIIEATLSSGVVDEVSRSLCKLLVALGDHSNSYFAANISSETLVVPVRTSTFPSSSSSSSASVPPKTRGHLSQMFLRMLLAYTGLPGYYGVDEEESEMTLGFWYLFQEALWSTDFYFPEGENESVENVAASGDGDDGQVDVAKAVYIELVRVLRRKATFPGAGAGWTKDQIDKFQVYRRDIGDILINAYYVLRDDLLGYYVQDVVDRLEARQEGDGWHEIEATIHCIMSVEEALDLVETPHLGRLFGPEILGRMPTTGHSRIRRTTLSLIGAYSSWFAVREAPDADEMLMTVLSYVVAALPDPLLCLQAASALRNLCDANRKLLAPRIAAFADLHAGLERIPDSEKSKVLQSIASVIQALPPDQEIAPVEAIINPIIARLVEILTLSGSASDEAQANAILQLEILAGIAKGLTRASDALLILDDSPESRAETEQIEAAREDPRVRKIHEGIFVALRSVIDLWSTDAGISHALSDLFKAITSLPYDTTLITLPAGPLLELVCIACQRQLTAAWLALATILVSQLNPPPLPTVTVKVGPTREAEMMVSQALPVLLQCSLGVLGQVGAMESHPDIVQEFFACMDRVAQDFTSTFYSLPPGALDALMQCAITALALQERYSLVSACQFLSSLVHRTSVHDQLLPHKEELLNTHGRSIMRAILCGFAGVAPRSVMPNLTEMLGMLMNRSDPGTAGRWMGEILFAEDFVPSKASVEAKEKFIKSVIGSRSLKRIKEAANQFVLIARGLEGSSFGYTSVSM